MRALKRMISGLFLFVPFISCTQSIPNCELLYGTNEDRMAIQEAMFSGSIAEVVAAINRAKDTKGAAVGCPQYGYGPLAIQSLHEPALKDIEKVWREGYIDEIKRYSIACPLVGRGMPSVGLGASYAMLGGYYEDLQSLQQIANMLLATQYSTDNVSAPLISYPGIYGYYFTESEGDQCGLSGIAGSSTQQFCVIAPQYCIEYNNGLFAGRRFSVTDHTYINDKLVGDLGGAGYDQGWSGVFMVENALLQTDPVLKEKYMASAMWAGEWALNHPPVTNHNYTSKLIWLLAQLYNATGREDFRKGLIDKLERNLVPGVLMDLDSDGFVDGMSENIPFAALADIAKQPGRNWDGHNALPWYHSMNCWAMLEAYVAFRDRGDTELAERYKTYAVAMINNLAYEIVNLGISSDIGPGSRDMPFSLLLGIWKLAQYENEPYPLWEQAIWAIWNSGLFESSIGEKGLNIPLYLLIKNKVPYVPLVDRNNVVTSIPTSGMDGLSVFPNPAKDTLRIVLDVDKSNLGSIQIIDFNGKVVLESSLEAVSQKNLDVSAISPGVYTVIVHGQDATWSKRVKLD